MPRNIEIKARLQDLVALEPRVKAIADQGPTPIAQDDTFFRSANGRLKLREFADGKGELIYYRRADKAGPKESFYVIAPVDAPGPLRETLTLAYGIEGRVKKHRTLYLIGQTRVHLDRVDGLGDFLELEVVLADSEATEHGQKIAIELLDRLQVDRSKCLEGAYLDMLRTK